MLNESRKHGKDEGLLATKKTCPVSGVAGEIQGTFIPIWLKYLMVMERSASDGAATTIND